METAFIMSTTQHNENENFVMQIKLSRPAL